MWGKKNHSGILSFVSEGKYFTEKEIITKYFYWIRIQGRHKLSEKDIFQQNKIEGLRWLPSGDQKLLVLYLWRFLNFKIFNTLNNLISRLFQPLIVYNYFSVASPNINTGYIHTILWPLKWPCSLSNKCEHMGKTC